MTTAKTAVRKPEWLKIKIQGGRPFQEVEELLRGLHLNTVCQEANCPNRMECYGKRTATFIILGRNCTRNCTFCNVSRELIISEGRRPAFKSSYIGPKILRNSLSRLEWLF